MKRSEAVRQATEIMEKFYAHLEAERTKPIPNQEIAYLAHFFIGYSEKSRREAYQVIEHLVNDQNFVDYWTKNEEFYHNKALKESKTPAKG